MRRLSLLLLACATLAAVLPAAAQTGPRRPPADTLRFGTTRPAAGDSIRMADYDAADEDAASTDVARADEDDDAEGAAAGDTVPPARRDGPYARARGAGPFTVQASGATAARPPRGEAVWLEAGRAAARRDTAASGTGGRVASGQTARRDTASAATDRPARRDTASSARRNGQSASASTAGGRTGSGSTTASTTTGRNGSATTATSSSSTSGRAGSASTSSSSSGARPRSHTVAQGETFYAIARRYGVTAAQLRALNPDVEMDRLEVGDVLRLPAAARDSRAGGSSAASGSGAQGRSGSQAQPRQGAQGQRRSHTVAAGETLFGIARRYGVTVDAIREANDMEGDQVRTGQRLVIPPAR